jgi:hypothetical protein
LPASLGNVPITLPTAPAQGTVIAFARTDSNVFTSYAQVTPSGSDTIIDVSPFVITVRNTRITFTYVGTTWYPGVTVGGASGMLGATPSGAYNPSLMSRDNQGRSQVVDPVAAQDIATKAYVDAHAGGGGGITSTTAKSSTLLTSGLYRIQGNQLDPIAPPHLSPSGASAYGVLTVQATGTEIVQTWQSATGNSSSDFWFTSAKWVSTNSTWSWSRWSQVNSWLANVSDFNASAAGMRGQCYAMGNATNGPGPNQMGILEILTAEPNTGTANIVQVWTSLVDGQQWRRTIYGGGPWTAWQQGGGGAAGFPTVSDQTALANVDGLVAPGLYMVRAPQLPLLASVSVAASLNSAGILRVYVYNVGGGNNAVITQVWYGWANSQANGAEQWSRFFLGGTWSFWTPLGARLAITDFNNARLPGDYNSVAGNITNGPGGTTTGLLHVYNEMPSGGNATARIVQEWYSSTTPVQVWVRIFDGGSWRAWQQMGAAGAQGPQGPAGSQGPQGNPGPTGPTGPGVVVGGTIGQALVKKSATDFDTQWAGGPQPLINYSNAAILATDPVSNYPSGITQNFMSNDQTLAGGWPCGKQYSQIVTYRTQDSAGFASSQWCMSDTNTQSFAYYRSGNQNGWGPWTSVGDGGWKTLTLASGFQAYGSSPAPQYRIMNGVVYYRGQVCPTSGSFTTSATTIVTALPAEAQATLQPSAYIMCAIATSSASINCRAYTPAGNPAQIIIACGASGAVYVDLGSFFYPLG